MRLPRRLDRVFATLGIIVFVVGWALVIYLVIDPNQPHIIESFYSGAQGRVRTILSYGFGTTTSASVFLWALAAYVHFRQRDGSASD